MVHLEQRKIKLNYVISHLMNRPFLSNIKTSNSLSRISWLGIEKLKLCSQTGSKVAVTCSVLLFFLGRWWWSGRRNSLTNSLTNGSGSSACLSAKEIFLLIKDPHICCPQIMHGILREYCDIQWHGSWLRCTFLMRVQYCLFAAQYLCNGK